MVSIQAGCSVRDAFVLMEQRAGLYPSENVESIAAAVVDRTIRFGPQR
jgi:hypothetical protein